MTEATVSIRQAGRSWRSSLAFLCPGCRARLDVEASHGWPYVRSAVMMHLDVCTVLRCEGTQALHCAEAVADLVATAAGVDSAHPFRCPLGICEIPER